MIYGDFIQTKQGFELEYEMHCNKQLVASVKFPKFFSKEVAGDFFNSVELPFSREYEDFRMRHISYHKLKNKGIPEIYHSGKHYEILQNNMTVGYIYTKKTSGFLKGYVYDKIIFKQQEFSVYTIELGKEGTKYVLCQTKGQGSEEHQVALMEKPTVVYNELDQYTWKALSEEYITIVGLYLLFHDFIAHNSDWGRKVIESKSVSYGRTWNKALLEKYNKDF